MTEPLAIDLFCGLGGWTEGLLAEGYRVVGFDIERHHYGEAKYPAQLVLQDVLTIHGRQFKEAALIVASPPCQEYSYMAMPWSIAKQKRAEYLDGTRDRQQLTALFDACFRIQREAIAASACACLSCQGKGHHGFYRDQSDRQSCPYCSGTGKRHIPLVVENVRGAQEWVGRSRFHLGSFHLWGDVPALMPMVKARAKVPKFRFDGSGGSFQTASVKASTKGCHKHDGEDTENWCSDHDRSYCMACDGDCPECAAVMDDLEGRKNSGGSWFAIGSPGQKEVGRNPVHDLEAKHNAEGNKGFGAGRLGKNLMARRHGSKSSARKAASATIAKIPLVLSRHIARSWKPTDAVA